jgi:hypothetical protein
MTSPETMISQKKLAKLPGIIQAHPGLHLRSQYSKLGNPLALTLDLKNVPLDMYEARNAA